MSGVWSSQVVIGSCVACRLLTGYGDEKRSNIGSTPSICVEIYVWLRLDTNRQIIVSLCATSKSKILMLQFVHPCSMSLIQVPKIAQYLWFHHIIWVM